MAQTLTEPATSPDTDSQPGCGGPAPHEDVAAFVRLAARYGCTPWQCDLIAAVLRGDALDDFIECGLEDAAALESLARRLIAEVEDEIANGVEPVEPLAHREWTIGEAVEYHSRLRARMPELLDEARRFGFSPWQCELIEADLYDLGFDAFVEADPEDELEYERELERLQDQAWGCVQELGEQIAEARGRTIARREGRLGRAEPLEQLVAEELAQLEYVPGTVEEVVLGADDAELTLEAARRESWRLTWATARSAELALRRPAHRVRRGRSERRSRPPRSRSPGGSDDPPPADSPHVAKAAT